MSEHSVRFQKYGAAQPDRRSFAGSSDARVIMGDQEPAPLRLWREPEPKDLSSSPRRHQPGDSASAKPSASPVRVAHAEFVSALAGQPPRTIPLDADAIDLEDRADHLSQVFSALSTYVAVILDDAAQNVSGRLDLPDVEAVLAGLAGDVTGTIQHAAEDMAGRIE
jgi:hypothetical protein